MTLRDIRANILMLCLAVCVMVACLEIGVRALAAAGVRVALELRRRDPASVQIVPLGELGFRQKPGARISYANGTVATANSLGYRGPLVHIPKPAGVFRVVLLGGSTTHGWFVSDNETIDAYMRQLLRVQRPGAVVEVINLAFDGYDSYQIMLRLRDDGLRFAPDVVIVNAGNVDVANARFDRLRDGDPRTLIWRAEVERLRAEQVRGRPTLWNIVKHWSYLARLPQYVRELRRNGPRPHSPQKGVPQPAPSDKVYLDAADYFERNLERIAETATAHGAVVLFMSEPWWRQGLDAAAATVGRRYYLGDAATTAAYRDTLAGRMSAVAVRLARSGKRVSYLTPDSLPPDEFMDDAHLKPAGNRRVAARLVETLISLIPAGDARRGRRGAGSP